MKRSLKEIIYVFGITIHPVMPNMIKFELKAISNIFTYFFYICSNIIMLKLILLIIGWDNNPKFIVN